MGKGPTFFGLLQRSGLESSKSLRNTRRSRQQCSGVFEADAVRVAAGAAASPASGYFFFQWNVDFGARRSTTQ